VDQTTDFGQAFPPHFRQSVYVLAINGHDLITIDDVLEAFKHDQTVNAVVDVQVWIVKRNDSSRIDIQEQRMMFYQVHLVSVPVPVFPDTVACRAVNSLHRPDYPEHIGQMMNSPFKDDVKGAHFEKYDNMYSMHTWSFPILRSLVPPEGIILPILPDYATKSTSTESLWEFKVRSCANGSRMKQGIHFQEYVSPVAMIESIHIILCMTYGRTKESLLFE
jgi:hypothetical protein